MRMRLQKKTMVIALVAVLACVAVYLNWSYQQGQAERDAQAASAEYEAVQDRRILGEAEQVDATIDGGVEASSNTGLSSEYFAETRLNRQKARDEAISILESTAASASATDDAKTQASDQIAVLAKNTLVEARIEGLVTAKGYADCVTFINADGVNVVVAPPSGGLLATDVARIKDIVISETGLKATAIKVVEAK